MAAPTGRRGPDAGPKGDAERARLSRRFEAPVRAAARTSASCASREASASSSSSDLPGGRYVPFLSRVAASIARSASSAELTSRPPWLDFWRDVEAVARPLLPMAKSSSIASLARSFAAAGHLGSPDSVMIDDQAQA